MKRGVTCSSILVQCRGAVVAKMMCNWDIAMENTMDPSHANWLHDGFAGKWEDAAVMTMRLADNPTDPKQVWTCTLQHVECLLWVVSSLPITRQLIKLNTCPGKGSHLKSVACVWFLFASLNKMNLNKLKNWCTESCGG